MMSSIFLFYCELQDLVIDNDNAGAMFMLCHKSITTPSNLELPLYTACPIPLDNPKHTTKHYRINGCLYF
jgi:hypothetical protein